MKTPKTPHPLFDGINALLGLKNDTALAIHTEIDKTYISRMRNRKCPVGAGVQVKLHMTTGMGMKEIKQLIEEAK